MRLGYLYSRYPVISQTFCDREMLELERLGWELEIGSVYSPLTSLRHEHIQRLRAPIRYAPPQRILQIWEKKAKANGRWPAALVDLHWKKYGAVYKPELRARNALWFADLFSRQAVDHFHVHFANRAAHTALFVKEISGIPFSLTAHGQDVISAGDRMRWVAASTVGPATLAGGAASAGWGTLLDSPSEYGTHWGELLHEICAAAEFVAAETDYSRDLLQRRCPDFATKIHRVYNGIDLDDFPVPISARQNRVARILSIGRLVAFKGFEYLIEACAELARRGREFVCEIIGDGPLREQLRVRIDELQLDPYVTLTGSLSQHAVLEKLRSTDIFALASTIDDRGGSDIFPTVILEAMAAARPVVSTQLAGIPELVIHEKTGLLVAPGETAALAGALDRLLQQPRLRSDYGNAGRARIEKHFQIEQTVGPLIALLEKSRHEPSESRPPLPAYQIAYLIDRWPDPELPSLESELDQMWRRNIPLIPFVCELNSAARFTRSMQELAQRLEFLPDAMAVEAEWRANRSLAQKLEEVRARQEVPAPAAAFLRQARFALALRKLVTDKKISHLHATSSRALVCALILQSIVRHGESVQRRIDLTVSATIESRPQLPRNWIKAALQRCVGGRVRDRALMGTENKSLLLDKSGGFHLTGRAKFWQEWARQLQRWGAAKACSDA